MKRILFLLTGILVFLLAFFSCADNISEIQQGILKRIVITAPDFEMEEESRTDFHITSSGAEFFWTANDTVGIFPNEGAQAYFPMVSGAGTKTAKFDGGGWALKDASMYAAYYHFIGDIYLDRSAIPVDYEGQTQTGNESTTHLGAYDFMAAVPASPSSGSVNFAFKHLGALVQLQLTIPEPATINSVTLNAETNAFSLEGKVDVMAPVASITPTDSATALTLHVKDVTTTEANQVVTLYLMIPPTDLSGQTLKAVVRSNEGVAEILLESKNFQAGKAYALKGKFEGGFTIETDYVDLLFDDPDVTTHYNESDGSLTVTYPTSSMPVVNEGNAIVLPAQYNYDIRVVESVSKSGNTLNLRTSQGDMTNLFRNTSFTLTTDPQVASRAVGLNVYTPTSYGYIDRSGRYVEVYNKKTASRAEQTKEHNIWEFHMDFNGEKIYDGEAGTLSWDKCEFDAGLKGTFTFDFGEKEINEVRKVGDLKKFGYKLTGSVGMDLLLHYEYEYEYHEYEDEIIKKNVIPTIRINFMVGIVPVAVFVDTHLGKVTECYITGAVEEGSPKLIDATAGVKLGTEVSVGMEWTPENGAVPTHEVVPTFEIYPLTVEANAYAEAKASYYPQIVIGLYKFLGPWFETRPYLKETVEAGFHYSPGSDDNYIGWQANTYNGMDLRLGLKLDFIGWEWNAWTSEVFNGIKDQLLFEAPSRIRTLSPENNIEVKQGESVTAEFMVESFSPITNQYYPCPLALINFEQEYGKLDKPLAVTGLDGKASVDWTPNPNNEKDDEEDDDHGHDGGIDIGETFPQSRSESFATRKLTAKVVKSDGEPISETDLIVKVEDKLREALIKLYESTNGDNWIHNDNWCSDKPVEEWYGIELFDRNTSVNVDNGHFGNWIDVSEGDYYIDLSDNNLTGYIDQSFPNDLVIHLNLCHNQLSLFKITECNSLNILGLYDNQLTSLNVSGCFSLKYLFCDDNQLSSLNISGCTSITNFICSNNQLTSLDVSACANLMELECSDNQLTSLDISDCTSLEDLNFDNNPLVVLDARNCKSLKDLSFTYQQLNFLGVSGCTSLESLNCDHNQLTSLNVSGCTSLESLNCDHNQLTSLNVSGCTSLESLYCYNNQLTSLDVIGSTSLKRLECYDNQLVSINVMGCVTLTSLSYGDNPLTTLNVSGCTSLEEIPKLPQSIAILDVSGCTSLKRLDCRSYKLTNLNASGCIALVELIFDSEALTNSLDVSGCIALKELSCYNVNLISLNAMGCTSLESLSCESNQLTFLNVTGCTALGVLSCGGNQLNSLDVSTCTSLRHFLCSYNQLKSLDVSNCVTLSELNCAYNQLKSLDVSGLSLYALRCNDNQLTSLDLSASECEELYILDCYNNNITSVIPDWLKNVFNHYVNLSYDVRYEYYFVEINGEPVKKYRDKGYGWWYPGEPGKGFHGPDNGGDHD